MVLGRIKARVRYRGDKVNLWAVEDFPRFQMANEDFQWWFTSFMAREMLRIMRRRAPVFTGNLLGSITIHEVKKTSQQSIVVLKVGAPYALYQEEGYAPHYIPMEFILDHYGKPGEPGEYVSGTEKIHWILPTKYTPFITPAYVGMIRKYDYIIKNVFNKAYKRGSTSKIIAG